jgi:hypothetical protein
MLILLASRIVMFASMRGHGMQQRSANVSSRSTPATMSFYDVDLDLLSQNPGKLLFLLYNTCAPIGVLLISVLSFVKFFAKI